MSRIAALIGLNRKTRKWEFICEPEAELAGKPVGIAIGDQLAKLNEFQVLGHSDEWAQIKLLTSDGARNVSIDFKSAAELKAERERNEKQIKAHEESVKVAVERQKTGDAEAKKKTDEAHAKNLEKINAQHAAINPKK